MTRTPVDSLLTTAEAARFLRVKPLTLKDWRRIKSGPPFVKLGARLVRYRREDLEAWAADNLVSPSVRDNGMLER